MPIDPQSLEAIRNPTGGRLTQLGMLISQRQQQNQQAAMKQKEFAMMEQLNQLKMDEAAIELGDKQSKTISAYAEAVFTEMQGVPPEERSPETLSRIQKQVRDAMPEAVKSVIPERTQSLEELRLGAQNANIYQKWLSTQKAQKAPTTRSVRDGQYIINQEWNPDTGEWMEVGRGLHTKAQGSEFERLERKVQAGTASPSEIKRHGVLAGTDIRKAKEITEQRMERESNIKQTDNLHKEYRKGSEHLRNITTNVDAALASMATGDTELSDKLLAQVMSQVNDTDVRAFQMYGEFNKPFGNLMERLTGQISRFFKGSRTQQERDTIATTLKHFQQNYADTSLKDMRNTYRNQAVNLELDPFKVVPPASAEDIRDYPNISNKEKVRLLKIYFPDMFTKGAK